MTEVLSRTAILTVVATTLATACEEPRVCYDGEFGACDCADGARGYQACSGEVYGPCLCDGTTPGLTTAAAGGNGGAGGSGGAMLLPFMEECESNEQCETGMCHLFPAKGSFCTKPCTTRADCPPPSTGCNLMGYCKAP